MAAPTKRRRVLDALYARAQEITQANGYETDAGQRVAIGEEPALGPDDPLGIAIAIGDEESKWIQPGLAREVRLPIGVHALVRADLDRSWWAVEAILGDVKRAIEQDATLTGLMDWPMEPGSVQTLNREPGSTTVGVVVTYYLMWKEGWGHP